MGQRTGNGNRKNARSGLNELSLHSVEAGSAESRLLRLCGSWWAIARIMRGHVPLATPGRVRPIFLRHLPAPAAPREASGIGIRAPGPCGARTAREIPFSPDGLGFLAGPLACDHLPALSAHHLAGHGIHQGGLNASHQLRQKRVGPSLAAAILRPGGADGSGILREGGIHSPEPGAGGACGASRGLAVVEHEGLRREFERGGQRASHSAHRSDTAASRCPDTDLNEKPQSPNIRDSALPAPMREVPWPNPWRSPLIA